jgi:tRNA A37 methylthiotransferase MiaB
MKIKFVSNGIKFTNNADLKIIVNPALFFMKAYYMLHGKGSVEWLKPIWFIDKTPYEQYKEIVADKPDFACFSVYVWNDDHQFKIMETIKRDNPEITVIAGGPQLDAHKDKSFFDKHPYIDYVCYGDGEQAMQLLIDRHLGLIAADTPLVNVVENKATGWKLWPFKMIDDEKYLSTSSFLIQKDFIFETYRDLLSTGIKKENIEFSVEFARGCMYSCSFCDWHQGLTKKVKRRKHDWRSEIDFFHDHDIQIRETDANFGQYPEDLDIFYYALSMYNPKRNFKFTVRNTSKLKREVANQMMLEQAIHYNKPIKMSLQDIDQKILDNIDRPAVPWSVNSKLIKELHEKLPMDKKHNLFGEIIIGIPGQTYESVINMCRELYACGIRNIVSYFWSHLINSPAADKAFVDKYNIKWMTAYVPNKIVDIRNFESIKNYLLNEEVDANEWTKIVTIDKHFSMSNEQIVDSLLFTILFFQYVKTHKTSIPREELDEIVNRVKEQIASTESKRIKLCDDYYIYAVEKQGKIYNYYTYAKNNG